MIVVGIDPGQASGGIAIFLDEELHASATINPWKKRTMESTIQDMLRGLPKRKVKVYYEVPQNGTHKSRGGVHFAAGMYVQALRNRLVIPRAAKIPVYPRDWRFHYTDDRHKADWKKWAIGQSKRRFGARPQSDDEAEAIMIAGYGAHIEEGG